MARKVIQLMGTPVVNEDGTASEAITPGMLVQGTSSIAKHSSAAGHARRAFALERDEMGQDIDVAYAANDVVKVGVFMPGQRVNALLASGQSVSAGDYLESAGNGYLRGQASTGIRLAVALETVNNSASTTASRIRVEVY